MMYSAKVVGAYVQNVEDGRSEIFRKHSVVYSKRPFSFKASYLKYLSKDKLPK